MKEESKTPGGQDDLVFDNFDQAEVKVKVGDRKFILREANGDTVCRYRNQMYKFAKISPEGRPEILTGFADTEPLLVSMCMVEIGPDGKEKPVPVQTVKGWPGKMQKALYEKALDISELREEEDIAALEKRLDEAKKRAKNQEDSEGN